MYYFDYLSEMIIDLRLTPLDCTNDGIEFLDRLRSEGLALMEILIHLSSL
jgi:hypothetical protein